MLRKRRRHLRQRGAPQNGVRSRATAATRKRFSASQQQRSGNLGSCATMTVPQCGPRLLSPALSADPRVIESATRPTTLSSCCRHELLNERRTRYASQSAAGHARAEGLLCCCWLLSFATLSCYVCCCHLLRASKKCCRAAVRCPASATNPPRHELPR